ncbi:hypothetical protein EYF80_040384 [Liparis tanakae]|uniref:Uncharacterized protein n=1 Tax=Liparis tanakae TaxID=230148 RepID=A0A4Z2G7E3_9TELE|nr:hypothetical protein EYF80_040384 [Liparis tanakae]
MRDVVSRFAGGVGTVGLAGLHPGVVPGVHQRQVAEQAVVLRRAVAALPQVDGGVVERVAGDHGAAVQVPRQHEPGEARRGEEGFRGSRKVEVPKTTAGLRHLCGWRENETHFFSRIHRITAITSGMLSGSSLLVEYWSGKLRFRSLSLALLRPACPPAQSPSTDFSKPSGFMLGMM